jgi:hypothetical protein
MPDQDVPGNRLPPKSQMTRSGRKTGNMDNGTVALAMGAMSFYWTMPMLLAGRKRRRPRRPATDVAPPADAISEPGLPAGDDATN